MRILVAGALGEVGSSVASALEAAGHEIIPLSSRAPDVGVAALSLPAAVIEMQQGRVDAVLHAAGRGDRRVSDRSGREVTAELAAAAEHCGIPAVLLSTTRVLEKSTGGYLEDDAPDCETPYAVANAQNEAEWLQGAPVHGRILRITNYFTPPMTATSPQTLLLPWSLVTEAARTGTVHVRSSAEVSREFVGARDVAEAFLTVVAHADAGLICATAPGLSVSLGDLVSYTVDALAAVGRPRPSVTFGDSGSAQAIGRRGWLHEHGWTCALSHKGMTRAIAAWLERVDLD